MDQFNQLQTGMTQDQVTSILGSGGAMTAQNNLAGGKHRGVQLSERRRQQYATDVPERGARPEGAVRTSLSTAIDDGDHGGPVPTHLDKARQQFAARKYKAAVSTLWFVEPQARAGDRQAAEGLLELSSQLLCQTEGATRRECEMLFECADQVLNAEGRLRKRVGELGVSFFPAHFLGFNWTPKDLEFSLEWPNSLVRLNLDRHRVRTSVNPQTSNTCPWVPWRACRSPADA